MTRLKVILIFDKAEKQKYKYHILEDIRRSGSLSLQSLVYLGEVFSFRSLPYYLKSLLYVPFRILYAAERFVFNRKNDSPSGETLEIIKDTPHLYIPFKRTRAGFSIGPRDFGRISEHKPDIILDLSAHSVFANSNASLEKEADPAKYGIWFFRMSKLDQKHARLTGFWEIMTREGELAGSIHVIKKGEIKVVFDTCSYLHQFSVYKSLRNHYLKLSGAFIRESESFVNRDYQFRRNYEERPATSIHAGHMILFGFRVAFSYAWMLHSALYNRYFIKTWKLLYIKKDDAGDLINISIDRANHIKMPAHTDWADPFIVNAGNKTYVFYEEIRKNISAKGHLCCAGFIPDKNALVNNQIIISEDYHISFPFIFNYRDKYYMIPESMANKTISLYESIEFPYQWKFKKNLFENVLATDTILYFYNGYWWLFSTLCDRRMEYNYDDLYLYYSQDPFGSWTPHPMNPVVSDVKTARGAGNIFIMDNKLIRPSQCCRFHYGYGLYLNEIKELDTTHYKEETIKSYSPENTPFNSIHTFNFSDGVIFTDAK